jgi:hypothetical protein
MAIDVSIEVSMEFEASHSLVSHSASGGEWRVTGGQPGPGHALGEFQSGQINVYLVLTLSLDGTIVDHCELHLPRLREFD